MWLLCLSSLFGIFRLWILSCSFLISLVSYCRWIFRMSRLSCDCLGCPFFLWMWLCWLGFLCVRQLHLLGVQIHLQMKCSNYFYILGFSVVVFNWEAYRCLCPLLPMIGGSCFSIGQLLFLLLMHDLFASYFSFFYLCAYSCLAGWWCFVILCTISCVVRCWCCVNYSFMPLFMFLCLATVDCSTLGTTGVDMFDNCLVGCVIDIVWNELLLLMFSTTLELAGLNVVVVGVSAIYVLW